MVILHHKSVFIWLCDYITLATDKQLQAILCNPQNSKVNVLTLPVGEVGYNADELRPFHYLQKFYISGVADHGWKNIGRMIGRMI